jgi:hypothetical protein
MNNSISSGQTKFWENLLRAAQVRSIEPQALRGASGQYHDVIALGLDEIRKRVIVVSAEHDARSAALVQYDIQPALTGYQVLTLRPVALSIPKLAQAIQTVLGSAVLTEEIMKNFEDKELMESALNPTLSHLKPLWEQISLKALPQILEIIQQLAKIKLESSDFKEQSGKAKFSIDLTDLVNYDPIADDRTFGICAIPLYDLGTDEVELIASASSPDDIVPILKKHHVYQYFFPSPDHLALGLIDRDIQRGEVVTKEINKAPLLGHPFGEMELIDGKCSPMDVIEALKEKQLIVEGEIGWELSEHGTKTRCSVKFKPKEGIISKLINQISIRLDLKDIFKGMGS